MEWNWFASAVQTTEGTGRCSRRICRHLASTGRRKTIQSRFDVGACDGSGVRVWRALRRPNTAHRRPVRERAARTPRPTNGQRDWETNGQSRTGELEPKDRATSLAARAKDRRMGLTQTVSRLWPTARTMLLHQELVLRPSRRQFLAASEDCWNS